MTANEEYLAQQVQACPMCAARLSAHDSLVQEYWVAQERHIDVWCGHCGTHLTLVFAPRIEMSEPFGDPREHP